MPNRIKICFWVEDLDTGERLRLPGHDAEMFQVELNFNAAEVEVKTQQVREQLAELSEGDLDKVTRVIPLGWVTEIVQAGFLTLITSARTMILKHLGYRTPAGMVKDDRVAVEIS